MVQASNKSKFVGTAEYVSPEVLMDKDASPASDLWALGCIIYQFFAGHPPFRGKSEFLIFEAILKADFTYPKDFPPAARKLCDRLLVPDPNKRLGSGPKDSATGYYALKRHEFFEGLDFAGLPHAKPPLNPAAALALQINKGAVGGSVVVEKGVMGDSGSERAGSVVKEMEIGKLSMVDQEKVIKEGVVKKKCGWIFYNKRKLVLTSRPRLSYYDPESGQYKVQHDGERINCIGGCGAVEGCEGGMRGPGQVPRENARSHLLLQGDRQGQRGRVGQRDQQHYSNVLL